MERSIDEHSVQITNIDLEIATTNLYQLQEHIQNHFQTPAITHTSHYMATPNPVFGRQDSVPDDALFGPSSEGSDKSHNKGDDNQHIPDFGAMGFDVFSDTPPHSSSENDDVATESNSTENDDTKESVGSESLRDDKTLFRRSISETGQNRRKRFSNRIDEEVFLEDPDDFEANSHPVRKSNSLPDLILSSSSLSSSLSPRSVTDCVLGSPDVVTSLPEGSQYSTSQEQKQKELQRKKELKDSIEGPSSLRKRKPSFKRSVSFSNNHEYREFDTNVVKLTLDTSLINQKENTADNSRERLPSTPEADKKRQDFLSKSSGYATGASSEAGSHEKRGSIQSQVSQGSSVWESADSANGNLEVEDKTNTVNKTKSADNKTLILDSKSETEVESTHSSDSNSGSLHTVIDTEQVKKTGPLTSPSNSTISAENSEGQATGNYVNSGYSSRSSVGIDLPNLSIMNMTPQSLMMLLTINEPPSQSKDGELGKKKQDDQGQESLNKQGPSYQQGTSYEQGPSYEQAQGNVPLVLDDGSFTVGPSTMNLVQKEDDDFIQQYNNRNQGGAVGGLGPGSMAGPRSGSGSYTQFGPSSYTRVLEDILATEKSPTMMLKRLQEYIPMSDSSSPSFTPGPSSADKPIRRDKPPSPDYGMFTKNDLERSSRCYMEKCQEPCCKKLGDIMRALLLDVPEVDEDACQLFKGYFESLHQHAMMCDELVCPVTYCQYASSWNLEPGNPDRMIKKGITEIQQLLQEPLMTALSEPHTTYTLADWHKMQKNIQDTKPEDFVSHIPLSRLGKIGSAVLCMDKASGRLCVHKKYSQFDYKHQLSLYTRLNDLDHPNVVTQLWLMECTVNNMDKIHVCSIFMQGGSLKNHLATVGALSWLQTVQYMQQILRAICYLHELGIVYLYWSSGNMLFPNMRKQTIKVGNFSLSYPDKCQSDLGATKICLPFNISPPELLTERPRISFQSDTWGAGCLLAEMLTGRPLWCNLRHEDRQKVHKCVSTEFPKYDGVMWTREQEKILRECCWQQHPEKRATIDKLYEVFSKLTTRGQPADDS